MFAQHQLKVFLLFLTPLPKTFFTHCLGGNFGSAETKKEEEERSSCNAILNGVGRGSHERQASERLTISAFNHFALFY